MKTKWTYNSWTHNQSPKLCA